MRILAILAFFALSLHADSRHEREQAEEIRILMRDKQELKEQLSATRAQRANASRLKAENEELHGVNERIVEEGTQKLDATEHKVDKTVRLSAEGLALIREVKAVLSRQSADETRRAQTQTAYQLGMIALVLVGFWLIVRWQIHKSASDEQERLERWGLSACARTRIRRPDSVKVPDRDK